MLKQKNKYFFNRFFRDLSLPVESDRISMTIGTPISLNWINLKALRSRGYENPPYTSYIAFFW